MPLRNEKLNLRQYWRVESELKQDPEFTEALAIFNRIQDAFMNGLGITEEEYRKEAQIFFDIRAKLIRKYDKKA